MGSRDLEYFIGCPGEHWVINSLAVLAAVDQLGADVVHAAQDLADVTPPAGRGARHVLPVTDTTGTETGHYVLIDDAYNANPTSMMAGLKLLANEKPEGTGRRIAVLGDMRELGAEAEQLHRDLTHPLEHLGIDAVFTVGPIMALLAKELPGEHHLGHFDRAEDAIEPVRATIRDGDVVLIKGSLGIYVSKIVSALKSGHAGAAPTSN